MPHWPMTPAVVVAAIVIGLLPYARTPLVVVASQVSQYPQSPVLAGVTWDESTLYQTGYADFGDGSDLWSSITWADDGNLYTGWGDGGGFGYNAASQKVSAGIARIVGGPTGLVPCTNLLNINGGAPCGAPAPATWPSASAGCCGGKLGSLGYIDGILWGLLSIEDYGPAPAYNFHNKIVWSTDNGAHWQNAALTAPAGESWSTDDVAPGSFLEYAEGNAGMLPDANDGLYYVYLYTQYRDGSLGAQLHPGTQLMRVRIRDLETWTTGALSGTLTSHFQFFVGSDGSGSPTWSLDSAARAMIAPPMAGVSYNASLSRYIGFGSSGGLAGLTVYDAPQPWGPWTTVQANTNWLSASATSEFLGATFVPKWGSGLSQWMVFGSYGPNGAPDRFHDRFNLIQATLVLAGAPTPTPTSVATASPTPVATPSSSPTPVPDAAATACPWFTTAPYVASGKTYEWQAGLWPCVRQYSDRDYKFTNVPARYQGMPFLQTADDDRASSGSPFLTFRVDRRATVYVALDQRTTTTPRWLGGDYVFGVYPPSPDSWTLTGERLQSGAGAFIVYARIFPAGTVVLGGNTNPPTTQGDANMYTVFVGP